MRTPAIRREATPSRQARKMRKAREEHKIELENRRRKRYAEWMHNSFREEEKRFHEMAEHYSEAGKQKPWWWLF